MFLTTNDDWLYGGGSICLRCGYMTGFQPVQLHPFDDDDDDKTVKDSCTRQQLQVVVSCNENGVCGGQLTVVCCALLGIGCVVM